MIYNAPSLANCNFLTMGQQVADLVEGGADFFHVDIMDGHYVPNLCFPVSLVADLKRQYPQMLADVHLMVTDPMSYLDRLQQAGADYVSFHIDSTSFVRRTITAIRERGMKAGVLINPSQRIDSIEPYIGLLDYVVLMTVEPGFAGQRFLPGSLERIRELTELRARHGESWLISVDGGVDYESCRAAVKLGANIFVTNIYTVFNQPDGISAACRRFKQEMALAANT